MVYSTALYFASQLEKLTNELLPSFSAKQKLDKEIKNNFKHNKINY
jgi:hypothetical protein